MLFQYYSNLLIIISALLLLNTAHVIGKQTTYMTNDKHKASSATNQNMQSDTDDISHVFVVNGLVINNDLVSDENLSKVPIIGTLQFCSNATCAYVSSFTAETSEDGVFNMIIDTTEDRIHRNIKNTEFGIDYDLDQMGKKGFFEITVKVNHPKASGYRADLTAGAQKAVLSEPVMQMSFILSSSDVQSLNKADPEAGLVESFASVIGITKDNLPWYLHKPLLSAPDHGQCLIYQIGKAQFAVLQRLYLFARDASDQIMDVTAMAPSLDESKLSLIWLYGENCIEYFQFVINLALGNIEASSWVDTENTIIPFQTCKGFNGHTITTCSKGDGIAQIIVLLSILASAVYFTKLVFSIQKPKSVHNIRNEVSLVEDEAEVQQQYYKPSVRSPAIQRFTLGNEHVVGIGKNTMNVLSKEGSDSLFQDISRSHVSRVAWMASSSSSMVRTPVRDSRAR